MIRISQLKLKPGHNEHSLIDEAAGRLGCKPGDIRKITICRKSIDARKKDDIRIVYTVDVSVSDEKKLLKRLSGRQGISGPQVNRYNMPQPFNEWTAGEESRPYVIGSGPAGIFCALLLAECGMRPVVVEQGEPVEERIKSVSDFWNGGPLKPYSNIQFGEGGAGTFSDGKLATGVSDPMGRKDLVLETFARFGAPETILYEARPHIGTDVLAVVVRNMREHIREKGGDFLFNTRFVSFTEQDGELTSISLESGGVISERSCACLALATGHSSRETFRMLMERGVRMEPKPFAVGVRIEHCQEDINKAQYGPHFREIYGDTLPAADYKLTYKARDGHSVYSFCMCPGGYVVNASSEPGRLCINGMSYSGRAGVNANSAIVVSVNPSNICAEGKPEEMIAFQEKLESEAFKACSGRIPTQRLGDFIDGRESSGNGHIRHEKKGRYAFADLNKVLPGFIRLDIKEALEYFGKVIPGFDDRDALISAVESRTSSPVKIPRDGDFQANVKGIFPCGEGAGYAGGITSAAIDGIKVFEKIYEVIRKKTENSYEHKDGF